MYVAIYRGRVVVAISHRQRWGPHSSTSASSCNSSGSNHAVTPAFASTWSTEIDGLLYAPTTTTQAGLGSCMGVQTHRGRYAAFTCLQPDENSQNADAEALGMLVAAYLSGCSTTPHSANDENSTDPPRQFLSAGAGLEALLRVRDGDLLLGSSDTDEHVLIVAHLRQGRVVGVQDLNLQFGGSRADGGSVLLRAPSTLKSDLDRAVLSWPEEVNGTKNFCSRVLSSLAMWHCKCYGRRLWYFATTVIEQSLNKISFAEKYWDSKTSGYQQAYQSLFLTRSSVLHDDSMLSTIPSTFMLIAAQDFSQMTKEYSEHKKFELGHHRTAYDQFVHQEAEHVPRMDKKTWTSASQLWSLRWATMPLEEYLLYHAQLRSDK